MYKYKWKTLKYKINSVCVCVYSTNKLYHYQSRITLSVTMFSFHGNKRED